MLLLVSVRHVGAHPGKHQHGVSIQISISLGKTFLRISRIQNIPLTWILARVLVYVPLFTSQILDFIYWTTLIFILIYRYEWRDTENQQLLVVNTTFKYIHIYKIHLYIQSLNPILKVLKFKYLQIRHKAWLSPFLVTNWPRRHNLSHENPLTPHPPWQFTTPESSHEIEGAVQIPNP